MKKIEKKIDADNVIRRNDPYFDINIDIEKLASEDLSSAFLLKDLQQRKLFLEYSIDDFYSISDIIKNIMQYNREDENDCLPYEKRKPILLYIASPGGSVDAGMALVDVIRTSKTPVYTINMGYAYSMAFLIAISGHKRFTYPTARFLLHDGSNFVYDSTSKVKDRMEFEEQSELRIKNLVLECSKITEKEYIDNLRKEWYMFPEEARKLGFVDYIIGVDSELSDIV